MDLLDRINALTDDQLQMVAERDDATGVLAAYRLAELRGLPAPEKEIVVMGDGYAIVASNGSIRRVEVNGVAKIIRQEGGEYCVYSEDGSRSFGCYPSMGDAQARLAQIHSFKAATVVDVDGTVISYGEANDRVVSAINGMEGPKIVVTARPEAQREETVAQLEEVGLQYSRLIMKPDGGQSTPSWKADIVRGLVEEYGAITAIDDDPDNREAMRGVGATVVAPGDVTKAIIREGSFVSWNSSGGRARGRVEYVMTEGTLGIPDSDFSINAEPDDPAVLIRVWRRGPEGWAETETLVGHKMSTLTSIEPLAKESYVPPQGAQEAGRRALDWLAEGEAGANFTDVGRARAAQLARGDALSEETIRRMYSYFARHEVDSKAEGWNLGEDGFPSAGRVAWDAWGGDAGRTWANMMVERFNREEQKNGGGYLSPVQNLLYESLELVAETFGKFGPGVDGHGAHYMAENPFAAEGIKCANCVFFKGGGGCEILNVRVAPEAVCKFWIIPDDLVEEPVARSLPNMGKAAFVKAEGESRFTLGPLYVPDFMDAHGEWTDADELQQAVWGWVKSGDRRIFLQHDREVEAGEWVEVMTMPQPWTVEMKDAAGNTIGQVTYPPNTVFLGVQWNQEAWDLVKRGLLRGYSIGGFSDRMLADLPENGERDGVEMP